MSPLSCSLPVSSASLFFFSSSSSCFLFSSSSSCCSLASASFSFSSTSSGISTSIRFSIPCSGSSPISTWRERQWKQRDKWEIRLQQDKTYVSPALKLPVCFYWLRCFNTITQSLFITVNRVIIADFTRWENTSRYEHKQRQCSRWCPSEAVLSHTQTHTSLSCAITTEEHSVTGVVSCTGDSEIQSGKSSGRRRCCTTLGNNSLIYDSDDLSVNKQKHCVHVAVIHQESGWEIHNVSHNARLCCCAEAPLVPVSAVWCVKGCVCRAEWNSVCVWKHRLSHDSKPEKGPIRIKIIAVVWSSTITIKAQKVILLAVTFPPVDTGLQENLLKDGSYVSDGEQNPLYSPSTVQKRI